ncbi:MAG: thiamine phosphate synthase [Bryobacteraceae bacterium]|nr:thiamine phosphate synthase [Bryobacteraceae bacterium]
MLPAFYPILDTAALAAAGVAPLAAAEVILSAGARILQLRQKEYLSQNLLDTARQVAALCAARGARFVINDRADVARVLQCGLHVGQDDLPCAEARAVMGAGLLGYSTHNAEQLLAAPPEADYLALGPIFPTASKENPDPVVGLANLRAWRPLTTRPLTVIGGLTLDNARAALDAGADSVAVIGALYRPPLTLDLLAERTDAWLRLLPT